MSFPRRQSSGRHRQRRTPQLLQRRAVVSGAIAGVCLLLLCGDIFLRRDLRWNLGDFGQTAVAVQVSQGCFHVVATRGLQITADEVLSPSEQTASGTRSRGRSEPYSQSDLGIIGYSRYSAAGGSRAAHAFVSLWFLLLCFTGYAVYCCGNTRPRR